MPADGTQAIREYGKAAGLGASCSTASPSVARQDAPSALTATALGRMVYGTPDPRTVAMKDALLASLRSPTRENKDAFVKALSLAPRPPRHAAAVLAQAIRDGER